MSDDNLVQTALKIDKDAKEKLKERRHGLLSEVVREAVNREAFGGEISERRKIEQRLEELRDERGEIKEKRARLENQLNEVERKIERAEAELGQLRDRQSEYEGQLSAIESLLHEDRDTCVWVSHPRVEEAAELVDKSPAEVIDELRERNPELSDEKFERGVGRGGRR